MQTDLKQTLALILANQATIMTYLDVHAQLDAEIRQTKEESIRLTKVVPKKEINKKTQKERRDLFNANCHLKNNGGPVLNAKPFKQIINYDKLRCFVSYWTEADSDKSKMKFEKLSVFDIAKRLTTWKNNNYGNKSTQQSAISDERAIEIARNASSKSSSF